MNSGNSYEEHISLHQIHYDKINADKQFSPYLFTHYKQNPVIIIRNTSDAKYEATQFKFKYSKVQYFYLVELSGR